MALKAKNDEGDEPLEDENSKFKSYITRKFTNANVKAHDKDRKQSRFSQFKS